MSASFRKPSRKRGTDGTRHIPVASACPVPSASQQPKPNASSPYAAMLTRFSGCAPPQPACPGCRQADVQDHPGLHHPFGSPATVLSPTRPVALRPGLTTGLPFSRMRRQAFLTGDSVAIPLESSPLPHDKPFSRHLSDFLLRPLSRRSKPPL